MTQTAPYDPEWVARALTVLGDADAWEQPLDESRVETWLENIYAGPAGDAGSRKLDEHIAQYARDVTGELRAFESSDELADTFE